MPLIRLKARLLHQQMLVLKSRLVRLLDRLSDILQRWACPPPASLSGDWTIDMQDSYGDGWNGASITVSAAGVATDYTIGASEGSFTVTAPPGELFTFTFNGGDWDSEITYQITDPNGKVQADHGPTPTIGLISLDDDFCAL